MQIHIHISTESYFLRALKWETLNTLTRFLSSDCLNFQFICNLNLLLFCHLFIYLTTFGQLRAYSRHGGRKDQVPIFCLLIGSWRNCNNFTTISIHYYGSCDRAQYIKIGKQRGEYLGHSRRLKQCFLEKVFLEPQQVRAYEMMVVLVVVVLVCA